MCGIFGYITDGGSGPDIDRLRRLATETQRRGHHAFGLAWLGATGAIHTFKRPGPATANLGDLDRCRDAIAVIGHCRWATHGRPEDNHNNHPHPAGRGWIVHNGVVANYAGLVWAHRLRPHTECDSEALGLLMAMGRGSIAARASRMAGMAHGPLAVLGLWAHPARLLIVRNGNPLWFGSDADGIYFASQADGLPDDAASIRDRYVGVLTRSGGTLLHEARVIG